MLSPRRSAWRCLAAAFDLRFNIMTDLRCKVARETIEQLYRCRRRAQPGELALGELARGVDAPLAQFGLGDFSVQELPYLPVADAAHRSQAGAQPLGPCRAGQQHQPEQHHGKRVGLLQEAVVVAPVERVRHEREDECRAGGPGGSRCGR